MVETEYEKEYFESGVKNFEGYDHYFDFPAHELRVDHIIEMFHPRSVLDAGCAYGYIVRRLLDKGIYAFGFDISHYAEEKAKGIIPHNFLRHDVREPLPFKDLEFDLLYCEGVLEHIDEKHIEPIMNEFARVAKYRLLQVALAEHPKVEKEKGHINVHNHAWWVNRMPMRTYLALQAATDTNYFWIYRG